MLGSRGTNLTFNFGDPTDRLVPGDYDGDGKDDPAVYRPSEHNWYVLPSSGIDMPPFPFGDPTDRLVPADYDGDGKTDFAVYRPTEGKWIYHASARGSDVTVVHGQATDVIPYHPVNGRRTNRAFDFDGDGRADLVAYIPGTSFNAWTIRPSAGGSDIGIVANSSTNQLVPGQWDGNDTADLCAFDAAASTWSIRSSADGSWSSVNFGQADDVAVPGDYDGDGKLDQAVYRASESRWYVQPSAPGAAGYFIPITLLGKMPVPGDYDGDGRTDAALYEPSESKFYVYGGYAPRIIAHGDVGDIPVQAGDYDGDGVDDFVVHQPWDNTWLARQSSNGETKQYVFGNPDDKLVPADYDGDGITDVAVFRPSDWNYYVSPSYGGPLVSLTSFATPSYIIPYHPFTATCGGFNPADRLVFPYDCTRGDFNTMTNMGWPASPGRRAIIKKALDQLHYDRPGYLGVGYCDTEAEFAYAGDAEWCSEFVRDMYLWSGQNFSSSLSGVTTVDDMRSIFASSRYGLAERFAFSPSLLGPGDYIAAVNAEGQHNGHSMMTMAVSDDYQWIYIINGNSTYGDQHCVTSFKHVFYDASNNLDPKFDAFGFLSHFIP